MYENNETKTDIKMNNIYMYSCEERRFVPHVAEWH